MLPRFLRLLWFAVFGPVLTMSHTLAAPGDLDPTFGTGGKVTTAVGATYDQAYGVALQSDGKIVVAGLSGSANFNTNLAVARYHPNGSLDSTFGGGGTITTDLAYPFDMANSVAVQPDGKLLVTGISRFGPTGMTLVRYQADGSLDLAFGTGGKVVTPIDIDAASGVGGAEGRRVLVQLDGKIVVSGNAYHGSVYDVAVVRYLSDGTLDPAFNGTGIVRTDVTSGSDSANSAALQADGKIVVSGVANGNILVARYNTDGALDSTFGNSGKVVVPQAGRGLDIAVLPNGKILVGGYGSNGVNDDFVLLRLTATGSLDTSFASTGMVFTPMSAGTDYGIDLVVQGDGKIVLGGYTGTGASSDFALARFTPDGSLDATFGTGGKLLVSFSSREDHCNAIALQPDGKIVAVGESYNGTDYDFAVARFAGGDPIAPVWVTRSDGPTSSEDNVAAVVTDSAGDVIVTGDSRNQSNSDFYTAKYSGNTGALLWERRYNGPDNSGDFGVGVAVDASGNALVTGYSYRAGGGVIYYTAKYAAADGALLWQQTYAGVGSTTSNIPVRIAVDSAGNAIVTGTSHTSASGDDFYTAKYAAADGALLWERRYDHDGRSDSPIGLALDSAGNVSVTGWSGNVGAPDDCYTAKYRASDGALLWEQRYDGPAHGSDIGIAVAADAAGNVIMTGAGVAASGGSVIFTIKYAAADGAPIWQNLYQGPGHGGDSPLAITVDSAGNAVVAGFSIDASGKSDRYTAKYAAADGALLWEKRYNEIGAAYAVAVDAGDNVIVTGQVTGGNADVYMAKYGATDGMLVWEQRYNGPANGSETMHQSYPNVFGTRLAVAPSGRIVIAATSQGLGGTDYAVVCYANGAPDLATQPPVLIAPVSDLVTTNPLALSFQLPESALGRALKLTFDDGITPRVQTLAPSLGTSGAHSFSFTASNPFSTALFFNGTPVPDGLYTVTLSYQDSAGNPAASTSSTNVRIDTTAPVITVSGANPVTVALDSTYVDDGAAALDSVSGSVAVNSSGSVNTALPGSYTITYTAFDGLGNKATKTRTVTVPHSPHADWRASAFGAQAGNPAVASDLADPNGNGLANLLEYALGGPAMGNGPSVAPVVGRDANGHATLSFTRYGSRNDLTLTVLGADAPGGSWVALARSTGGGAVTAVDSGATVAESGSGDARTVTVGDAFTMGDPAHPQRFLRLEVSR
jgi:uncharacterized delta-60 repeat protein